MIKIGAKERILDTAGRLFQEKGYQSVGINEIIEKSETAKASFYNHFPSKEKLCADWLCETHRLSEARHNKLLCSAGRHSKILDQYFNQLKDWMVEKGYRGCPFSNTAIVAVTDSEMIRQQIQRHKLYHRDFFVELARFYTQGSNASKLGNALFILYSGATTEAQNLRTTWPIDAALEAAHILCAQCKTSKPENII